MILFILSRVFFLAIASFSHNLFQLESGYLGIQVSRGEPPLAWVWANLDGRHFIKIATVGYTGTNFAYFPLYPILINLIGKFTYLTPIMSGISISVISTLLAVYFLLKLAKMDKLPALESTILILFFPFSFILNSVYADALFLFLTTAAFYFARKKEWFLSGCFALLASFTRFAGLALFPALIIEWWTQSGYQTINLNNLRKLIRSGLLAPLLNLSGFVFYTLILQFKYGNWLLFQTSLKAWKQEKIVFTLQVVYRYLKIFVSVSPHLLVYWVAVMEFVSFFLYFILGLYVYKNIRKSYGVFMMVLLVLVSFTGTFAGTPRYLVHLFPAYFGLSLLLNRHPKYRFIYYPLSIILGIVLTALFVRGHFVG